MNTEHGQIAVLSELGTKFDSASFNWQLVRQHGLVNCCVKPPRVLTCGKILSHALNKITAFREKLGVRICVFQNRGDLKPCPPFCSLPTKWASLICGWLHLVTVLTQSTCWKLLAYRTSAHMLDAGTKASLAAKAH